MNAKRNARETDRVRAHTDPAINDRIDRATEKRIRFYATQDRPAISRRLAELDQEWDIQRVLQTAAPSIAFTGLFLGLTVNKKWLLLPAVVLPFLLVQAVQGWAPPVPVLRRLGVRTRREIDEEKYALKALRGDLDILKEATEPGELARNLIHAVRI